MNGFKLCGKGYNNIGDLILELEKNGKGIEYYRNGNTKFIGEYLNDKKWNGKGFDQKGMLE